MVVLMNEMLTKIIDLISSVTEKQGNHDSEILRIRYEMLELITILKESNKISTENVQRIYKKGETYEQSSNESRGSSGDLHQSLSES